MYLMKFFDNLSKKYSKNKLVFLSISPQNKSNDNQYVVKQLKNVTKFSNKNDNNIALDGDYGTGKSSILNCLRDDIIWDFFHRSKTVSFLSFQISNNNTQNDEEISKNLQSEIVRQLYYGEKPNKLKGSGYIRIGKTYFVGAILLSIVLSLSLYIFIYRINIPELFQEMTHLIAKNDYSFRLDISTIIWLVITLSFTAIFNLFFQFISNGNIKSVSAKDLSIDLTDKNPDFTQLIDLLIFYFKKTKRRVIFFEDLDRANNPRIFDELRQLNFTINNSRRKKIFGSVKFIYAIKSDIFCASKNQSVGVEKINSKIFDLIIPVIPFLTRMNFSYIFKLECQKVGLEEKFSGIENILSRHSADMRVVKFILNNIIAYQNTFDLNDEKDYRNIAALSVLRVYEPEEFIKISTGKGQLDKIRKLCTTEKQNSIEISQKKQTSDYYIENETDEIWQEIRKKISGVPIDCKPLLISINGDVYQPNGGTLRKINSIKNIDIYVEWEGHGSGLYPVQEVQDIINSYIEEKRSKALAENEVDKLAKMDCFSFFTTSVSSAIDNKNRTNEIIKELIENNFLTEGYVRFISRSESMDRELNNALRFIHNYIRDNKEGYDFVLNEESIDKLIKNTDNTDWASTGIYNFYLFDFLIKNIDQYADKLERVLLSAKNNVEKIMIFLDKYCFKYKKDLEVEYCKNLDMQQIKMMSYSIPPIFLIKRLAELYPNETINSISLSSLRDTNAKEVIFNIAVMCLKDPQNLKIEEISCSLLKYYSDTILTCENGRDNLFKLYIANSISFDNIKNFEQPTEIIKNNLEKIIIEINIANLDSLDNSILIDYIKIHKISKSDFFIIMESNKNNLKNYIVKNIEESIEKDDIDECITTAVEYVIKNKISLIYSEIIPYLNKIDRDKLIKLILNSALSREELSAIMRESSDSELNKIEMSNRKIRLSKSSDNVRFAKLLVDHGLVIKENSKDKNIIRLSVK
ncbi:MAG: hypothetical protein HXL11_01370 [Candidatus Nanosynbacter sp.]|nr:hypothetical protein [Candidatus Nanosynbacter sp.]